MNKKIVMKISPDSEFVSAIRYVASVYANSLGFDVDTIEDIKLVVSEACNNAILYGDPEHNKVTITFFTMDNQFCIEIVDNGYGFEPDNHKEPDLSSHEGSGLGVYIIKSIADYVEFNSDSRGTVLTMKFDLR